jgi:hypothetical protein
MTNKQKVKIILDYIKIVAPHDKKAQDHVLKTIIATLDTAAKYKGEPK